MILDHSPSDVLAQALIGLGLAVLPGPSATWPVHVDLLPDLPDNCVACFVTEGRDHGRTGPDSERQVHHGVQVRLRSTTYQVGYTRMLAIVTALDVLYQYSVSLGGANYAIHSFNRDSEVLVQGKESPQSQRVLFTVSGHCVITQL